MIIGDQIRLRAIEKEDLPSFVKWLNDPEVRQELSLIMPLSLAEEEDWFASMLKRSPFERPLAIEIQPDPQKAEIGIHIGEKEYWNQGYGTKAMRLMLKHGFENLNLHRLWLRVFKTNQRAIRSYEKSGFTLEGKFREGQYLKGKYVDVMIMSMLHSEWQDQ